MRKMGNAHPHMQQLAAEQQQQFPVEDSSSSSSVGRMQHYSQGGQGRGGDAQLLTGSGAPSSSSSNNDVPSSSSSNSGSSSSNSSSSSSSSSSNSSSSRLNDFMRYNSDASSRYSSDVLHQEGRPFFYSQSMSSAQTSASVPHNSSSYPAGPSASGSKDVSQYTGTTMYRRLERERAQLEADAFDGLVFILPVEYQTDSSTSSVTGGEIGEGIAGEGGRGSPVSGSRRSSSSARERVLRALPPSVCNYSITGDAAHDGFTWLLALEGAANTIYEGEIFLLKFNFSPKYPIEAPEVTFLLPYLPQHPHVYSNGHICLSILYDFWSPALSVSSCGMSLLSMLSSNRYKSKPPDDDLYCRLWTSRSPKQVKWIFHDDQV